MIDAGKRDLPTGLLMRRLICYVRCWWSGNALCWILFHTWPILSGLLAKAFFDDLQGAEPRGFGAVTIAALVVALGLTRAGIVALASMAGGNQRFRIRTLLWNNLLRRIFSLPGACALPGPVGDILSTLRDDVEGANEAVDVVFDTIAAALFACGALAILVRIDAHLTLLVYLPVGVVIGIAHAVRATLIGVRERSRQTTARVTGTIGEVLAVAEAVQVSCAQDSVINHLRGLCDERRQAALRERWQTLWVDAVFKQTANLGTGLVLLAAASRMQSGTFTVGDFALFATYLTQFADFTGFLGYLINTYRQSGVSFRRMVGLLQGAPTTELVAHRSLPLRRTAVPATTSNPVCAPPSGDARFSLETLDIRRLACIHPQTGKGIHDVSFSMRRGSLTVVTGRIGSGKTTLLRAILGLLPVQAGEIVWNGQVVGAPGEFMVPPRATYTPQTPVLLSGTLRDNIAFGKEPDGDTLDRSIQDAMLSDDIAALAAGLDTLVGVRGTRLSGGQVQRTAAARMFTSAAELYVCDDISSALDVNTERQFWERARQRKGTWLIASHNPEVLSIADQIIVLEGRASDFIRTAKGPPIAFSLALPPLSSHLRLTERRPPPT